ncbi:extracellular solute-binding protein [Roseibium sediminis]|uniref:extracellular solute-binding protein n=1 Tax=Roseibium sediminis TaxID=1775174 RepID=UPI00123D2B27|nr:extracellular solute-binding protein [Roseibium sediminis]
MSFSKFLASTLFATSVGSAVSSAALAEDFIIVQSTTSTQNSGLLDAILPAFEEKTGIDVRVVAVGTGQALKNAANGDGDVLLVHAKPSEEKFVTDGYGVERFDVMYNDFVLVGPKSDPAGIRGMTDVTSALKKIAETGSVFASRGDDSGTHKKEKALWTLAEVDAAASSGGWYRETGSGMGATLNAASGMDAYALSDRATWLAFENKGNLDILTQGDDRLFNQYGVILVNPEKHANVKAEFGQTFIDWLTGEEGQKAIASFKVNGEQLFFPNAKSSAPN